MKNLDNTPKKAGNSERMFAIRLSFAVGIFMLILKWYAFSITNSAAILSDAAESVVHILGVGFAFFSMWLSIQPADANHPYGHDKISFFSAGAEGVLIVLAAIYIIYEAITRLLFGIKITNIDEGTYFILGASIVNLLLGIYLVMKGKKTKSLILVANGKHVLTDSWTSFAVVVGLGLTILTGWLPFDPIIAMIAAVNILWSGGKLVRQASGGLMDESNPETKNIIIKVLDSESQKRGLKYHNLRYRESGDSLWVEFHLLYPKKTSLGDAHLSATEVEYLIKNQFEKKVHVISHLEPLEDHDESHEKAFQKL